MDSSVFVVILSGNAKIRYGRVLLIKNRPVWKIFCSPRKEFFKPGKWGLPGGKKESEETITEAIKREVKEETGYGIEIDRKIIFEQIKDGYKVFTCLSRRILDGKLKKYSKETIGCEWFSISALPLDMYRSHRERLWQILSILGLKEAKLAPLFLFPSKARNQGS